jgi:hypothetical protein
MVILAWVQSRVVAVRHGKLMQAGSRVRFIETYTINIRQTYRSTTGYRSNSKPCHRPLGGLLNLCKFPGEQVPAMESPSPRRSSPEGSGLPILRCILIPERQLRKLRLGKESPEEDRQRPSKNPESRKEGTPIRTMPGVCCGRWQWVRNHRLYRGYLSMQPYQP